MTATAAHYTPVDHVPKSLRDSDCRRYSETIARRKSLFRQARGISTALRTLTDRQRGKLTRADGLILSLMVLANLRACVRRERQYRPTRAGLAKDSGYSERTVSASLARLRAAGIIVVARYGNGGRLGEKGKGLSTEFRSGCLQFLSDQLAALGYRLPKGLRADLDDLAKFAATQVGQQTEPATQERARPTGKKLRSTSYAPDRATAQGQPTEPVEAELRPQHGTPARRGALGSLAAEAMPGRALPPPRLERCRRTHAQLSRWMR